MSKEGYKRQVPKNAGGGTALTEETGIKWRTGFGPGLRNKNS